MQKRQIGVLAYASAPIYNHFQETIEAVSTGNRNRGGYSVMEGVSFNLTFWVVLGSAYVMMGCSLSAPA